jgi:hypothetical protein
VPKNVLILATKYDRPTSRTFQWAKELHDTFIPKVDACFFVDVTGLCPAGGALAAFTKIATHVIYYGHGEPDWWTALPGNPNTELIGQSNLNLLQSAAVYAVCCSSLTGLGSQHAHISSRSYIGYDDKFRFDYENEDDFKQIVNRSAVNFVLNGNASQRVTDLQKEWTQLENAFAKGAKQYLKNAAMAGSFARDNAQRIGEGR